MKNKLTIRKKKIEDNNVVNDSNDSFLKSINIFRIK